jgi:hypothetical protein
VSLLLLFSGAGTAAPPPPEPTGVSVSGAVHYPFPVMVGGRELHEYEQWRSRLDDDDLAIISTLLL